MKSSPTIPNYSRPPGTPDTNRDGHRQLEKLIPSCRWYEAPRWLSHRCRRFDIDNRQPIDCGGGRVLKPSKKPARYIEDEFAHFRFHNQKLNDLFDHWGTLKLPDGRTALHSSPYHNDPEAAAAFAAALGLALLSAPGDLSHYGYTASWFLWAEPLPASDY